MDHSQNTPLSKGFYGHKPDHSQNTPLSKRFYGQKMNHSQNTPLLRVSMDNKWTIHKIRHFLRISRDKKWTIHIIRHFLRVSMDKKWTIHILLYQPSSSFIDESLFVLLSLWKRNVISMRVCTCFRAWRFTRSRPLEVEVARCGKSKHSRNVTHKMTNKLS